MVTEFTKLRDELSRQRRELPWERVEKPCAFDGPSGKLSLSDLFSGRSQPIVYHADDMVVAELSGNLLPHSPGRKWIQARRPELYRPLTIPTGLERSTRALKFEE